jgi:predicted GNAT family N-acyltransferase
MSSIMKIKELSRKKLNNAIPLIWEVFSEFEAVDYPEQGKQEFWNSINSEDYLDGLKAYGAFEDKTLIGIIAVRNEGSHIALFCVNGADQGKGIGRSLWNTVLADNTYETITVNSSLFATSIYEKLGFVRTAEAREENGIRYVPMEYRMKVNADCPCSKEKCVRHGHCNECRAHHAGSKKQRPCEK